MTLSAKVPRAGLIDYKGIERETGASRNLLRQWVFRNRQGLADLSLPNLEARVWVAGEVLPVVEAILAEIEASTSGEARDAAWRRYKAAGPARG